ncbi:MAG: hypothetical protein ACTSYA_03005 [Candidatus Kariarchaeaceae archaeon]
MSQEEEIIKRLKAGREEVASSLPIHAKINEFVLWRKDTFIQDQIGTFQSLFPNIAENLLIQIIAFYGLLSLEEEGRRIPDYSLEDLSNDLNTLIELADPRIEKEEEVIYLIGCFYEELISCKEQQLQITNEIINLKSFDCEDTVIMTNLTKDVLEPLLDRIKNKFEFLAPIFDLRWAAALIQFSINKFTLEKTEKEDKFSNIYSKMVKKYPLSSGKDIYWDLLYTQVIEPSFNPLLEKSQKQIQDLQNQIEEQKGQMSQSIRATQQQNKERSENLDIIRSSYQIVIDEIVIRKRAVTEEHKQRIHRGTVRLFRRLIMDKYGVQDVLFTEEFIEIFENEIFEVFDIYPELALPIILKVQPSSYRDYIQEPKEVIMKLSKVIKSELSFHVQKRVKKENINIDALGRAFAEIITELAQDKRVQGLDL